LFQINNLGKKYGNKWVLRDLNLYLPSKGLVAIVGPSGSGKSTFLNLLSLLEKPSEGSVVFNGKPFSELRGTQTDNYRNEVLGFVFQHHNLLLDENAFYNVELPLLIRGRKKNKCHREADAVFRRLRIEDLENRIVGSLSGGEKQRVAIARALVGDPLAILADEPTGSLDEQSSRLVMDILKKISLDRLVIFVSHSERMVSTYADRVITLEDGLLKSDSDPTTTGVEEIRPFSPSRPAKAFWVDRLLFRHFRRDKAGGVISFFASFLGAISLLLSFGFAVGGKEALEDEKTRTLLYTSATFSLATSYPIENSPLVLTKQSRPTKDEAAMALSSESGFFIANDYSYFFPLASTFYIDGECQPPSLFAPIYDLTLSEFGENLLCKGRVAKSQRLDEVLVNEEFAALFTSDVLGETITVNRSVSVTIGEASDIVDFHFSFQIVGIVNEFSFLNSPRVYYSYPALSNLMENTILSHVSINKDSPFSIGDAVSEAAGSDACSSYGYLIFAHDRVGGDRLRSLTEQMEQSASSYLLSSSAFAVEKAYSSLLEAFSSSIVPFMVMGVCGIAFVIGSMAYSGFLQHRKEAAILHSLGARKNHLRFLYVSSSVLIAFASAFLSLLIVEPLVRLLNPLVNARLGVDSAIRVHLFIYQGMPFIVESVTTLFLVILALAGSGIPLYFALRAPLVEELRDE
jgi:ABC-type lipoprotein export system ATPase subunit/ABC-type antimicrobial peptide transport system permease subunit